MHSPKTVEELQQALRELPRAHARGGGSKPALSRGANLSLAELTGILQYDPGEFTFTARAGTTVREVQTLLAEQRQFLPSDPPLADSGATLGGTVAAGLSGPGRLRYGGVRDFLLGVRLVTGDARIVFGGGKVVKNAAGFDIPKLMCGALGKLGVLAELTFKVFPLPQAYGTLRVVLPSLSDAVEQIHRVAASPLEPAAIELLPPGELMIRVGGLESALDARLDRLRQCVGSGEILRGGEEAPWWQAAANFHWAPADGSLLKIPLSLDQIPAAEALLNDQSFHEPLRRYSVAGNVLHLAWPSGQAADERQIERLATSLQREALILRGDWPNRRYGVRHGQLFHSRLASVFDPRGELNAG